ncbi:MAG: carboxypeptidase regulatory-like domain-containing protein [Symploca sp. SIO2E9]|nr:carboxypeptidase regulatory-like domain-containing protein [Symploca sp. SIO2E9]
MKLFYGFNSSILCFLLFTTPVTANQLTTETLEEDSSPRDILDWFTLKTIGQRITITGRRSTLTPQTDFTRYQGELTTVGTAFGGNWFVGIQQPDFRDRSTWRLGEAQFLLETKQADYVIGSQPEFWHSKEGDDYWGVTAIRRWGFAPPKTANHLEFNPRQRLRASQLKRTVSGEATPGTLVQLKKGLSKNVFAEVLVDASGRYRFEDIPAPGNYRLFLYANGQLTAKPTIEEVNLSSLPEQLPAGASALAVSAGWNREVSTISVNSSFWGKFTQFQAGISYRLGVSEGLTLGLGLVYEQSVKGLAELFYQPTGSTLQVEVSALVSKTTLEFRTNIRFEPFPNFQLSFISVSEALPQGVRLSQEFKIKWRILSGLTLTATANIQDEYMTAGVIFKHSSRNLLTSASINLDANNKLRWSFNSRLGPFSLTHQGNQITTNSEIVYSLFDKSSKSTEHSLLLNYKTRNFNTNNDNLASLGWRYRSPEKVGNSKHLLEVDLAYGIGSQGNGIITSVGTALIPGLVLRLRYQEVSVNSDANTFRIELIPNLLD